MSSASLIVYGPMMCGKTRNAEKMRESFGLDRIIDDWDCRSRVPLVGALILTNNVESAKSLRTENKLPYAQAARLAGVTA